MPSPRRRRTTGAAVLLGLVLALAACGGSDTRAGAPADEPSEPASGSHATEGHHGASAQPAGPAEPLRPGERRLELAMPEPYTPSPPTDAATDDYRCFLLDPGLEEDAYVTGTDVAPGNPDVVHHVILFNVPPEQLDEAEQLDDATEGQGWTCFGDSGLRTGPGSLDDAPWLGAWAPGGSESVMREGYGAELTKGSRIVMQVHYNLLATDGSGDDSDVSAARLRVAPASQDLTPVTTMLMPAPVELPCRPGRDDNPLCERDAALADLEERVGYAGGANWLHILCGSRIEPGPTTSCDREVQRPTTVLGVAGHMHLLGKQIRIDVNPGEPDSRRLLDIEEWDFDNQGAKPVEPLRLKPGDTLRVTCRHSQEIRDDIPAFAGEGRADRYVVWGEGTSDEMCLGILQVVQGSA